MCLTKHSAIVFFSQMDWHSVICLHFWRFFRILFAFLCRFSGNFDFGRRLTMFCCNGIKMKGSGPRWKTHKYFNSKYLPSWVSFSRWEELLSTLPDRKYFKLKYSAPWITFRSHEQYGWQSIKKNFQTFFSDFFWFFSRENSLYFSVKIFCRQIRNHIKKASLLTTCSTEVLVWLYLLLRLLSLLAFSRLWPNLTFMLWNWKVITIENFDIPKTDP